MKTSAAKSRPRLPWGEVAAVWWRDRVLQSLWPRPFLPRAMHLLPTYRCNARCIMCGIWSEPGTAAGELPLDELERILSDRLFRRLEFVGISGGEPFLRRDLPDLVAAIARSCPRLKRISLTTNALMTERVRELLPSVIAVCRDHGLLLDVSVSFHGLGDQLARIYGVDDAFDRIGATLTQLQQHRALGDLTLSLNCVLLRDNLDQAPDIARWAAAHDLPISFVVGELRTRFRNQAQAEAFLGDAQRPQLLRFLRSMDRNLGLRNLSPLRYRELVRLLEGRGSRTLPCYYAMGGLVLGHDGQLYYCSHSRSIGSTRTHSAHDLYYDPSNLAYRRRTLLQSECRHCPPYTLTRWEIEANPWGVVSALLTERWRRNRRSVPADGG